MSEAAASDLENRGKSILPKQRVFGHIEGIESGTHFANFAALFAAGVHRQTQAGISGSAKLGAESIVSSGGYKDDQDFGHEILYTGQGGRDAKGRHIVDQTLERGNRALVVSELEGLPLRVIRGAHPRNEFAPVTGYRYDGLFRVDSHWCETGEEGFKVWRFRLLKIDEQVSNARLAKGFVAGGNANPRRVSTTVQRIVRDTTHARNMKLYYRHACQVCGIVIRSAGGDYIEAAHIRPLGKPHDGPDISENIICLCPNHHVMFDLGIFSIDNDFRLIGLDGVLNVLDGHFINRDHLAYHREHFLTVE